MHFLLYKFFEKPWKPGAFGEETLGKCQILVNSINDESSDTISFDQKVSQVLDEDQEEEDAARHLVLTLKQTEQILSRMKYKGGEIPDSIMKLKQEAYNKVSFDDLVCNSPSGNLEAI